jgi:hypothetical protein
MRTFDRTTFLAARLAWETGEFGWQWQHYRRIAAERGYIFPPTGTRHDDREAASPSQRAIVWAAIEENPTELERIVRRCSSWSQVVDQIIGMEARLAEDAGLTESDARWEREHRPVHREAVTSIAAVLERIAASRGIGGKA